MKYYKFPYKVMIYSKRIPSGKPIETLTEWFAIREDAESYARTLCSLDPKLTAEIYHEN